MKDRPNPRCMIGDRPNPKCIVAGCGKEVTWDGSTLCPEHGGQQRAERRVAEVQAVEVPRP